MICAKKLPTRTGVFFAADEQYLIHSDCASPQSGFSISEKFVVPPSGGLVRARGLYHDRRDALCDRPDILLCGPQVSALAKNRLKAELRTWA
ncbi:MAG: hypothetical protein DRI57_09360 [Deltaproteobacteria bacterium]|nr:MAG: hypothetical protein DRI57_09360 [Deltaproteobacteria bacterium]